MTKKILKFISTKKIYCILHFAAQAGVRYAVKNPKSYIHSNVDGFKSIISIVRKIKPKILYLHLQVLFMGMQKNIQLRKVIN